jgi:hypothetical protein
MVCTLYRVMNIEELRQMCDAIQAEVDLDAGRAGDRQARRGPACYPLPDLRRHRPGARARVLAMQGDQAQDSVTVSYSLPCPDASEQGWK